MELPPISLEIWDNKYRYKEADGTPVDKTIYDTWDRVSKAMAACESDQPHWAMKFQEIMLTGEVSPAGRIIAGLGTSRDVTASNCYVMGTIPDSISGIFDSLKESALTLQQGGGIGMDFSTIRPKGALVKGVAADASGPLSFMDVWDSMCRTIMSAGARRGAMMATMRCLSGDSMVHTIGGRVAIKDLVGLNPIVYSCDPVTSEIHAVKADKVFVSDHNRMVVRVHFDDLTHLDCTPDHRIMLRSGHYAQAKELRPGDRIKSIVHSIRNHGKNRFVRVSGCSDGRAELDHRIVARDILEEDVNFDHHVHHMDEDSLYNDPSNLKVVTRSEHAKLHNDAFAKVRERIAASRKGKTLEEVYGKEKADEWKAKYRSARQKGVEECIDQNHRVVSVETLKIVEEVYDISLPVWHNFAVNGVFVHNCDHPDIEAFIAAKKDPLRLRMFNVSVLVTDAFMEAVKDDSQWVLIFDGTIHKSLPARDLWKQIMESTYAQAEPGVIFIDRMNKANNLRAIETIAATNPCGEQPLPPYGACLLGSINLAKLVIAPFQDRAALDPIRLIQVVTLAIRALDNVIDVSNYPLPQQKAEAVAKRRIGLGVTGLADALLLCGLNYDSEVARNTVSRWMKIIAVAAYEASLELAKEKGAFPLFNADEYLTKGTFASTLPKYIRDGIRKCGIRNSHLLSIAPTGTISLLAGNVSSGIEPIFAAEYTRKVLQKDGSKTEQKVVDYAVAEWRSLPFITYEIGTVPNRMLPPGYVDAQSLSPSGHVLMQAVCQEWVDTSISKTINLPEDISFEAFQGVYQLAYDMGCKGCTTYRPNAVTGSVLSVDPPQAESEVMPVGREPPNIQNTLEASPGLTAGALTPRPQTLTGKTYKVKMGSAPATYVTINDIINNWGSDEPFELFLSGKDVAHHAWMAALSRMISAIFRRGGDVSFVVEELRSIHDPKGGAFIGGKYVPSLPAAIGDVIAQHLGDVTPGAAPAEVAPHGSLCPRCQSYHTKTEGGCVTCLDCGHSTCG